MPREAMLVKTLVELADNLVEDFDVVELLTLLADRSVEVLDVSTAALMLIAAEGDLRFMASSTEATRTLELFELQSQEGPSLDCFHSGATLINLNLEDCKARWPLFASEAIAAGFQTLHTFPMRIRGSIIGVLSLFHTRPIPITDSDVEVAQALADIATIAIVQHRGVVQSQTNILQLTHALSSRIVLEQAKGILSERNGIDTAEAFAWMRRYARGNHLKMTVVAEAIISGTLMTAARIGNEKLRADPEGS